MTTVLERIRVEKVGTEQSSEVNISISESKLFELLDSGALAGDSFRCLDRCSKACVRKIFLKNCENCIFRTGEFLE